MGWQETESSRGFRGSFPNLLPSGSKAPVSKQHLHPSTDSPGGTKQCLIELSSARHNSLRKHPKKQLELKNSLNFSTLVSLSRTCFPSPVPDLFPSPANSKGSFPCRSTSHPSVPPLPDSPGAELSCPEMLHPNSSRLRPKGCPICCFSLHFFPEESQLNTLLLKGFSQVSHL